MTPQLRAALCGQDCLRGMQQLEMEGGGGGGWPSGSVGVGN